MELPWESEAGVAHATMLAECYKRLTHRDLVAAGLLGVELARQIYEAPFVVVSHGTEPDPVLNYGNATAQRLWEMSWEELTRTPSRFTAEAPERDERARLLAEVARNGFIANYSGTRVSKTGRRFRIARATVWNLQDGTGRPRGQAATFADWTWL